MVTNHSSSVIDNNSQRITRSRTRGVVPSSSTSDLPSPHSPSPVVLSSNSSAKAKKRRNNKMASTPKNGVVPNSESIQVHSNGLLSVPVGGVPFVATGSRPRLPSSASSDHKRRQQLQDEEAERKKINLFRSPLKCVYYFFMESLCLIRDYGSR